MIRVVLDTNVLVSIIISPRGTLAKILEAWEEFNFLLLTSPAIVEEVENVLKRPYIRENYNITRQEIDIFIQGLKESSLFLHGIKDDPVIKEDPSDNKFLAVAKAGEADYIVSGDRHLKNIKRYENIPIISPVQFASYLSVARGRRRESTSF
ncbi:MAG: putative toxin-antitoxin system toxin component, PIN family [Caldiserica bacterium]|nr:putative toxin-antitoxin system toxin component, PIN family [Caldisericota bacterium]